MAHKLQLFGKVMSASLTLWNAQKDVAVIGKNYSADRKMCVTHGECRLQLVACWLTHFVAALCPRIIPIAWSENARADLFSTFFIPSLWESWRKNDLRRMCRWAAAEGGRGMWPGEQAGGMASQLELSTSLHHQKMCTQAYSGIPCIAIVDCSALI